MAELGSSPYFITVYCPYRAEYLFFFRGVKEKRNPCANCATGCELKNLYEKKRSECSEERKETKKNAADSW